MNFLSRLFRGIYSKKAKKVLVEEIFDNYLKSQASLRDELSNTQNGLRGSRILLVEDCPDQQRLTLSYLKKQECLVDLECNGDSAFLRLCEEKRQSNPYDYVIMDLYLINSNGIEATVRIRELDPTVSIVGITAYVTPDVERLWKAAGCNVFLPKPFTKEQLIDSLTFLKARRFDSFVRRQPAMAAIS